jgi:hypothetical protein
VFIAVWASMLSKITTLATFHALLLGILQREASMSSTWIRNSIASSTQTTSGTACRRVKPHIGGFSNFLFPRKRGVFCFGFWLDWLSKEFVLDFGSDQCIYPSLFACHGFMNLYFSSFKKSTRHNICTRGANMINFLSS